MHIYSPLSYTLSRFCFINIFNFYLFSVDGDSYFADCRTISKIEVIEVPEICTKDIAVILSTADQMQMKIESKNIFLTKVGVLREKSEQIECDVKPDVFQTKGFTIVKSANKVAILEKIKPLLKHDDDHDHKADENDEENERVAEDLNKLFHFDSEGPTEHLIFSTFWRTFSDSLLFIIVPVLSYIIYIVIRIWKNKESHPEKLEDAVVGSKSQAQPLQTVHTRIQVVDEVAAECYTCSTCKREFPTARSLKGHQTHWKSKCKVDI